MVVFGTFAKTGSGAVGVRPELLDLAVPGLESELIQIGREFGKLF